MYRATKSKPYVVQSDPCLVAVVTRSHRTWGNFSELDFAVSDILISLGFEPYIYDPLTRKLSRRRDFSSTTIFARDIEILQERCMKAKRFRLATGSI